MSSRMICISWSARGMIERTFWFDEIELDRSMTETEQERVAIYQTTSRRARKWPKSRTLLFVACAGACLWALIIASALYL
jgi:hypothetical protein